MVSAFIHINFLDPFNQMNELVDIVRGSRCMVVVLRAGYPEVLDACGRVLDGATCLLPEESLCRTPVA